MAKAMVLSNLKSTDLEKSLGATIYNKNKKIMDEYIMSNLRNGGEFSIPIIQTIAPVGSRLGKQLIELYDRKIILEDSSMVSDEMKILQASAFDGLVIGVNTEKSGEMAVYTANAGAIFGVDSESKFSLDKTVDMNTKGIVNAVRIDISYTSESGFEFKAVSLNKNTCLQVVDLETGEGRFFLVPYLALQRSMVFFKEQLDDGRTLEVTQEVGGLNKVRYISSRVSELAKYSDSKEFVETLKPEYFPLKGFFYAPVLGASSLTVGRTRVDVVNVSKVAVASKPKVEKASDALSMMLCESSIQRGLVEKYKNDEEGYAKLVSKFPKIKKMFSDMDEVPSPVTIMKYYHQLRGADLTKIHTLLSQNGIDVEAKSYEGILNRCEAINIGDYKVEDIKNMLKEGVYKFNIRKKDCEYSTMIVTNNEEYLKKMYGEDYFRNYESLGIRLYKLESMLNDGKDIVESLKYCGFPSSSDTIGVVKNIIEEHVPDKSTHERLAELFKDEDKKGKGVRKSTSNDSIILARKCFASLSESGAVDYYRYLDISKVTSMYRLG